LSQTGGPIRIKESRKSEWPLTVDLLRLVVLVLDRGNVDARLVGEEEAIRLEILVPGKEDGVEHGLVEEEVTHPLGDDDIKLLDGELDLLELALDEGDLCGPDEPSDQSNTNQTYGHGSRWRR
jgi:hypothetical protein